MEKVSRKKGRVKPKKYKKIDGRHLGIIKGLIKDKTIDRNAWPARIHVAHIVG